MKKAISIGVLTIKLPDEAFNPGLVVRWSDSKSEEILVSNEVRDESIQGFTFRENRRVLNMDTLIETLLESRPIPCLSRERLDRATLDFL